MRVLIVYHAGATQNARAIFAALAQSPLMDLTVVVPQMVRVDRVYDVTGWLRLEDVTREDGYQLLPVPLSNPSNYRNGFEKNALTRILKSAKPAIVHVLDEPVSGYLFQVTWLCLQVCPNAKVLFYGFENLPISLGRLTRSNLKWRLAWRRIAGGAAANSEALENVKRAGFPRYRPLERVFWGIDTRIFHSRVEGIPREQHGFDCARLLGFVGRLLPEKGCLVLLAAMRLLPTDTHCIFIGSGPLRIELELFSAVPELAGRVHFLNAVNPGTVASHMRAMDALIVPSLTTPQWKEQYGRVIAEAMACGVPVVGSDSGAIPETIGSAGIIVPEGDHVALANAIIRLFADNEGRETLRSAGLDRVETDLSMAAMARHLAAFYERVAGV